MADIFVFFAENGMFQDSCQGLRISDAYFASVAGLAFGMKHQDGPFGQKQNNSSRTCLEILFVLLKGLLRANPKNVKSYDTFLDFTQISRGSPV